MVQERPDYSVIGNVAVSALPRTATSPVIAVVGVTDAGQTLQNANVDRLLIVLQNNGTSAVYVRFAATPSVANYHVILAGGAAVNDGTGATLFLDVYTGIVTAICAAGLTADVAVSQFLA